MKVVTEIRWLERFLSLIIFLGCASFVAYRQRLSKIKMHLESLITSSWCPRSHCSYLDIYISRKIRVCVVDLEGKFQNNTQGVSKWTDKSNLSLMDRNMKVMFCLIEFFHFWKSLGIGAMNVLPSTRQSHSQIRSPINSLPGYHFHWSYFVLMMITCSNRKN